MIERLKQIGREGTLYSNLGEGSVDATYLLIGATSWGSVDNWGSLGHRVGSCCASSSAVSLVSPNWTHRPDSGCLGGIQALIDKPVPNCDSRSPIALQNCRSKPMRACDTSASLRVSLLPSQRLELMPSTRRYMTLLYYITQQSHHYPIQDTPIIFWKAISSSLI